MKACLRLRWICPRGRERRSEAIYGKAGEALDMHHQSGPSMYQNLVSGTALSIAQHCHFIHLIDNLRSLSLCAVPLRYCLSVRGHTEHRPEFGSSTLPLGLSAQILLVGNAGSCRNCTEYTNLADVDHRASAALHERCSSNSVSREGTRLREMSIPEGSGA